MRIAERGSEIFSDRTLCFQLEFYLLFFLPTIYFNHSYFHSLSPVSSDVQKEVPLEISSYKKGFVEKNVLWPSLINSHKLKFFKYLAEI
jgi:hypothetical protein